MFVLSLVVCLQNNFVGLTSVTENTVWARCVILAKGALHWVCSFETCGGRKHTYGNGWSLFRRLLESQSPSTTCSMDLPKPGSQAQSFQSICARTGFALGHQPVQKQRMGESVAVWEGVCVLDTHSG